MKVGIVSDTHGKTDIFLKIVEYTIKYSLVINHWFHAGDNYKDFFYLSDLTNAPVTAVAGNCDYQTQNLPQDQFLELNKETFWLTHGHRYNVKQTARDLVWWGKQYKAGIVVFGHTHVPYNKFHDGMLFFNPGSLSYPRGNNLPSFGIITICEKNGPQGDIITLNEL